MRNFMFAALSGLVCVIPVGGAAAGDQSIPQDPIRQQQRNRDMLEWNRRTLAGAYEKVGKKNPRWDKEAHEALEAAARWFSHQVDPCTQIEEIYVPAKRALDAGCDDPLILYLYARFSYKPNFPGREELDKRYTAAAAAMEHSTYPPFRRAVAQYKAGLVKADGKNLSPQVQADAQRLLNAALALLSKSAEEDEWNVDLENNWFDWSLAVIQGYRLLSRDYQAAFDRVDAALSQIPALNALQLKVKGISSLGMLGRPVAMGPLIQSPKRARRNSSSGSPKPVKHSKRHGKSGRTIGAQRI